MLTRPISLNSGTSTLAKKTSNASGYIFEETSSSTPPMMVLGAPEPSWMTVSTG